MSLNWSWKGEKSSVKIISKDFLPVDSFGHYSQLVIFYFTTKRLSVDILNIDLFYLAFDNEIKSIKSSSFGDNLSSFGQIFPRWATGQ